MRRLKLQTEVNELDQTLQIYEESTFGGLWIEHTPKFRVVVQFTDGMEETISPYVKDGPLADLIEVQEVSISLQQLRASHNDLLQVLQSIDVLTESDIDLQAGSIEIYVTDKEDLRLALLNVAYVLPDNVQIVEIPELSRPMTNWYAGNRLSGCTSGFSLWNNSYEKFSSTAGHCSAASISPLGSPVLTVVGGAYDFQVNPGPTGDTIKNWAADNIFDATPYYREINGWWSTVSVGTTLCKYGKTTGFTCGTVQSNNYSYQGSPTWLLVNSLDPNHVISCNGDSGSPVYSGSIAGGELVAGWCDLSNNKFIAMPAGKYSDYGYYILTSP